MGIYVSCQAVSPEILQRILERPELSMEALAPAELEQFELGLQTRPEDWCSLDKAWHAVHYLFNRPVLTPSDVTYVSAGALAPGVAEATDAEDSRCMRSTGNLLLEAIDEPMSIAGCPFLEG